jgi:hypothetical protein
MRCIHHKTKNVMTTVNNMQAFNNLIGYCTGYGGKYNPGRQNLRIEALQSKMEAVRQTLDVVKETRVHFSNEVNARKQAFDQLPVLVASVMRTLEATGASAEKLANARTFVKGFFGRLPKSATSEPIPQAAATPAPVKRSRLQMAYVSKVEWFARLIETVATEPLYQPNEEELSVAGLQKKLTELHSLNQRVTDARIQWSNALVARNELMYDADESLLRTAMAVKKYLRAVFGYSSPQYSQVKNLILTKASKS